MSDFERALNFCLKWEGGYSNDPNDPGGETNYGISKRAYPDEDIKAMTRGRAAVIYQRDYWDKAKCNELPAPVNLVHFDCAVNTGIGRANRILQQAAGVISDGVVGPKTIFAIAAADPASLAEQAIKERENFYIDLAQNPKLLKFRGGWLNRCAALHQEIANA